MENEKKLCMNAQEAIAKAEQELITSFYIADISRSPGMKVIHSNRCRWLSVIVGLAKKIASGKAVEVVHGRWINPYMNRYGHPCHCCSVCGFKASYQDKNYCPNCGADMRGMEDG